MKHNEQISIDLGTSTADKRCQERRIEDIQQFIEDNEASTLNIIAFDFTCWTKSIGPYHKDCISWSSSDNN